MTEQKNFAARSIRRYTIAAGVTIAALLAGVGGWAATANLSSAVIGGGVVVVDGHVKKIQHREGGIIGDIRVRNGTRVKAGDLLVRLDDTIPRSSLAIVTHQIDQLTARRLRLTAERDNATEMAVSPELIARSKTDAEVSEYLNSEKALFAERREMLEGQKAQLLQRIDQIAQETGGLTVRRKAKEEELSWIEQELVRVRSLNDRQLIQFNRLAELERLHAQLDGERGQLITEIARTQARATETRLQILQLDRDRRAEVATELRDVDNKLAELAEQQIASQDALRRIDIRAPQPGIVHELAIHTVGGVIGPGELLMQIVPVNDTLVVEARFHPADIDQLHVGQKATLRFSAFNQRTTPEIFGEVKTISADLAGNPQTGEVWYTARLQIPPQELSRLGNLTLVAGMPVETFIQTGERTALSYLVKPFSDQIAKAMREE